MQAARWRAIGRLTDPEAGSLFSFPYTPLSFVRAFSYVSGPPYGLLLDERLPGWRKQVRADTDLAALLGDTVLAAGAINMAQRAAVYGEAGLRLTETDRAAQKEAQIARYRAPLVDGPILHFQFVGKSRFNFNPSSLVTLDKIGVVYPTFHATAGWGTLDVKEGMLLTPDMDSATLAAPTDTSGAHIQGQGWMLDLAPGWHVVPSGKPGSYILRKD